MNIPQGIVRLQAELSRVRTALGFASDAAVATALADLAAIEVSARNMRDVLTTLKAAEKRVSEADEGTEG